MRETSFLLLLLFILGSCNAQQQGSRYTVAFYNVENLFDTVDDPATSDEEFTPAGAYRYTNKIYRQKLNNIATVISKIDPDIIGLAEVENNTVLEDLINQPQLKGKGYKYVWYNSPDPRGIDVALLYDPKHFKVITSMAIPVRMKGMATRDVLYVKGALDDDTLHVHVNHWPSRGEGLKESLPKRRTAAIIAEKNIRRILAADPNSNVIVMGDMNDNPDDETITKILGATNNKNGKLYNPWFAMHKSGKGTSVYHHQWNHYDQVIVSGTMLDDKGIRFHSAGIYDEQYIRNPGHGANGYPLRSFKGRYWNNGYSDHFPVVVYFTAD